MNLIIVAQFVVALCGVALATTERSGNGSCPAAEGLVLDPRILENRFTTGRSLLIADAPHPELSYEYHLGQGFLDFLHSLSTSDQWFDEGTGSAWAARPYIHSRSGAAPRFVGVGLTKPDDPDLDRDLRLLSDFKLLYGRYFEKIPREEIGISKLGTDVGGMGTWSADLFYAVNTPLNLLPAHGRHYMSIPLFYWIDGKRSDRLVLIDHQGRTVEPETWMQSFKGVRVIELQRQTTEAYYYHKRRKERRTDLRAVFERTEGEIQVPKLIPLDYTPFPNTCPGRRYRIE